MRRHDWLRRRLDETPSPLREELEKAVAGLEAESEPAAVLVATACRTLDGVRGRLDERAAAFDLLLADGLLTLACDAAAFGDPDAVVERCRAMGPSGELGRLARKWAGRS
ncbi:MAG: hypothetical protein GWN99_11135 [Gemmatimonadetes bacterium]|uniref:Uncharacterized protein n=1 Tax=Candidatus Kutchimonas denitrificans TaxID=3056748 RepID=A0AAE5CBV3_9BACT|nr:hypothetical protein [Gemmatimonadota bacterium]NIR75018.1 hypothetical protein [Candidatus Kutchimonas denitrificans]NIS01601.1 hypothetical protein [Gemmatimonadota bacterium]NIT67339.1 hypothetical protein [Gemmatimonadota bacterium]NIU52702.1 hypothetical protein [Gemmatimonadota bacterium]